jgi:hypothetical protein
VAARRTVRDQIVAETRGNPLALLELPQGLSPAQLAGGFGLPSALPLSSRIEDSFRRRVDEVPHETQELLLLAAADPSGDPALLWRAAAEFGLGHEALLPAKRAGLLEVGARLRFRHPLVRSAVYRAASPTARHQAHAALAQATDPDVDPDRRAWHRAQATLSPDEDVAAELEQSAGRAQGRGGLAAAAAFLERAAALTVDPARRAERLLAAVRINLRTGAFDAALSLLATAEGGSLDELQRARAVLLRGQIAFVSGLGSDAPPLLLDAARRLEPLGPRLARETYLDAWGAALFAAHVAESGNLLEVSRAAGAAPPPSDPQRDALGIVFGLSSGPAPDRFLVGLAVLSLLSEAAEERPLLGVIDDAQWLDHASAQVLGFVARRLVAEPLENLYRVVVRRGFERTRSSRNARERPTQPVDASGGPPAEALLRTCCPFHIGDGVRFSREEVGQDQFVDARAFGDAADLGDIGVKRGHSLQRSAGEAVSLEVAEVGNTVDEDVGPLREGDQIVVDGGVAREHDGPVRGVEAVRESRNRPAVRHCNGADPNGLIFEHGDRDLGDALGPRRDPDVDRSDQRARVRHPRVQRHDVQVVGVAGEDVLDQVRRARVREFRVNRRLSMEGGVAGRHRFRSRRPVHADRGKGPRIVGTDTPRVKEHADQITRVVDMQVAHEHGFQSSEVEPRVDERGGRSAAAVDHENSLVDDERRRDPRATSDGHRCPRRSKQHQFDRHIPPLLCVLACVTSPRAVSRSVGEPAQVRCAR